MKINIKELKKIRVKITRNFSDNKEIREIIFEKHEEMKNFRYQDEDKRSVYDSTNIINNEKQNKNSTQSKTSVDNYFPEKKSRRLVYKPISMNNLKYSDKDPVRSKTNEKLYYYHINSSLNKQKCTRNQDYNRRFKYSGERTEFDRRPNSKLSQKSSFDHLELQSSSNLAPVGPTMIMPVSSSYYRLHQAASWLTFLKRQSLVASPRAFLVFTHFNKHRF